MTVPCPRCGTEINTVGVGYCSACGIYTDWRPPKKKHAAPIRDDPRTEKQIQAAVRLRWELHGWIVADMSQSRPTQQMVGFSDLVCFHQYGGGVVFCEVKAAKGRQSNYQREFGTICDEAGVPYIVVRHEDDVDAYLETRAAA